MRLKRAGTASAVIPLVPMIDVLMIMLVFFMVTSTYLNLRMIPMAEAGQNPETPLVSGQASDAPLGTSAKLLIRLDASGQTLVRGRPVSNADLAEMLSERLAASPELGVIVLPSGRASTQALVSLLDVTTSAGIRRLRVVRLREVQ